MTMRWTTSFKCCLITALTRVRRRIRGLRRRPPHREPTRRNGRRDLRLPAKAGKWQDRSHKDGRMTSYRERKPSASRRAGLAALGALTLASCIADNRPYPAKWGERPTVAEHTCSDIAGSYAGCEIDKGDRIPQCLNFLGPVVNVESSPGQYSATSDPHAKIEQTANQMRISLYADDQQLGERVFLKDRKDGFSCTTEGIAVSNGSEAIQHDFYMPGTYTMIKDKEGHLIVKYHESGGGLGLGIIPAAV